ncbi:hypothetical protein [Streptomyces sp. NPDC058394]
MSPGGHGPVAALHCKQCASWPDEALGGGVQAFIAAARLQDTDPNWGLN